MKSRAVSTHLFAYIVALIFGIVSIFVFFCQCSYLALGNTIISLPLLWLGFDSSRFVLLVSSFLLLIKNENREQKTTALFCFVMTLVLSIFISLAPLLFGGLEEMYITYSEFIVKVLTKRDGFPATLLMLLNCIYYGCFLFAGVPENKMFE